MMATFQVLNKHMWLMVTNKMFPSSQKVLWDSAALKGGNSISTPQRTCIRVIQHCVQQLFPELMAIILFWKISASSSFLHGSLH